MVKEDDLRDEGWRLVLPTPEATQALGAKLGELLQPGDVIGLDGPLGAGKTCLVQGLARGLEVPRDTRVSSPTFTLMNEHPGRLVLYHVDLYRLNSAAELDELGLWEAADSGGVMAVEWLARFPRALPLDRLHLDLSMDASGPLGPRHLLVRALGPRAAERLQKLRDAAPWFI